MPTFGAPYLPYDHLRQRAEAFLRQYHPSRSLPVPIEMIVERDFGMDIVPLPGLQRDFDTVAFISRDLASICVDDYVMRFRENRYRFSLAHELAHQILHSDVFRDLDFQDLATWKQVEMTIPEREYSLLEFHANSFAGLVLVPEAELDQVFTRIVNKAEESGVDLADAGQGARDAIEEYIGKEFAVSQIVVHRRVEFDELWDRLQQ